MRGVFLNVLKQNSLKQNNLLELIIKLKNGEGARKSQVVIINSIGLNFKLVKTHKVSSKLP